MGEEHALRIPRCAGGVAQHRRRPFVDVCPHVAALRCEQYLIIKRFVGSSGYFTHHDALDLRTAQLADRIECKFSDGRVMEEKFTARMLEDEFDLSRGQSHVDRIQHSAERRNREIKFEMPVRVPCQARNAIALSNTEPAQHSHQSRYAIPQRRIVIANRLRAGEACNLALAVVLGGMVEQLTDCQLLMHHQSLNHGFVAPRLICGIWCAAVMFSPAPASRKPRNLESHIFYHLLSN